MDVKPHYRARMAFWRVTWHTHSCVQSAFGRFSSRANRCRDESRHCTQNCVRHNMNRRHFLLTTAGAALAQGATSATVLFQDQTVALAKIRPDAKDLWVRAADLPRINQFTLKPAGACRADMCIPVPKALKSGEWFNLTGFAQRLHHYAASRTMPRGPKRTAPRAW
jgi:hypothetical protein